MACWYDMQESDLTLQGMKEGVERSRIFLLILTRNVLRRPFCRKELIEALRLRKDLQLLVEEDERFQPFDPSSWKSFTADSDDEHASICDAIEAALTKAVVFRRRKHEVEAMVRELGVRAGLTFPKLSPVLSASGLSPTSIFVIGHRAGFGGDMVDMTLHGLKNAAPAVSFPENPDELGQVPFVLVFLNEGVLSGNPLRLLRRTLEQDRATPGADRLLFVCRVPSEGWIFSGKPEVDDAPAEVKEALKSHEALTFRAPSTSGSCHEFPAMLRHLLWRLRLPVPDESKLRIIGEEAAQLRASVCNRGPVLL